jgi:hypothetical protein
MPSSALRARAYPARYRLRPARRAEDSPQTPEGPTEPGPRPFSVAQIWFYAFAPWIVLLQPSPFRPGSRAWVIGFFVGGALAILCYTGATLFHLRSRSAYMTPGYLLILVVGNICSVEGLFALDYHVMSDFWPQTFGSSLTAIDAAYFTISTATTTGMGDIHPVSSVARLLVTGQMVVSLALIVAALGLAFNRFFTSPD